MEDRNVKQDFTCLFILSLDVYVLRDTIPKIVYCVDGGNIKWGQQITAPLVVPPRST